MVAPYKYTVKSRRTPVTVTTAESQQKIISMSCALLSFFRALRIIWSRIESLLRLCFPDFFCNTFPTTIYKNQRHLHILLFSSYGNCCTALVRRMQNPQTKRKQSHRYIDGNRNSLVARNRIRFQLFYCRTAPPRQGPLTDILILDLRRLQ